MQSERCSIVFEGRIVAGRTIEDVKKNLALLFKVDSEQIERLFVNAPRVIKKNLSQSVALKYKKVLERAGAVCKIKPAPDVKFPETTPEMERDETPRKHSADIEDIMVCPACNFKQDRADECIHCGTVIRKYLQRQNRQIDILSPPGLPPSIQTSAVRSNRLIWCLSLSVLVLLVAVMFYWRSSPPIVHEPGVISPYEPVQSRIWNPKPFLHRGYRVTPLATFEIEALVLSSKRYYIGREAELSPVDLALGWGRMSDAAVLKDIKIKQSNRFYFWKVKRFPIPRKEIIESSANMHIIPANEQIERHLKDVRKGNVVNIKGYLVRLDAKNWYWKSSLSRSDTGRGACEVVWAEDLDVI